MKLIIAGSRHLSVNDEDISNFIKDHKIKDISEVVCGCARGIDKSGESWAKSNDIPVKHFPADWDWYGKSAGMIRNALMAGYGDELLLIWDGKSSGAGNMKKVMESDGSPVHEVIITSAILSEK